MNMIQRCTNPKNNRYYLYGARGIRVCDRWRSFRAFLADMGTKPADGYSIERRDNDGHYEPGNCYWATRREQNRNRRGLRKLTHNGETLTLTEWSERTGIKKSIIRRRLRDGLSVEEALVLPVGTNYKAPPHLLLIEFQGVTKSLTEWAKHFGMKPNTISYRLKHGWSVERALTTSPLHRQ